MTEYVFIGILISDLLIVVIICISPPPPFHLPHAHAVLLLGFTQAIYEAVEAETQEVCVQIFNGNLDSDVMLRVFIKITNSTGQ